MVGEHLKRRARREFESTMASNLLLKVITMIIVVACSSSESLIDPFGKENDDATILGYFREVVEKDSQNSLGKWKDDATTTSPCKWKGVTCSHDNRVTALDLSSFSLQCNFSTIYMLFGLQKLETLVASSNGIHGNITTSYLGGGYRPTCSDSLTTVDLSDNNLQGPLSSLVLGGCKNLVMLNISKNELTSPEKKRDFYIKTLKILDISNNKIALLDSVVSTNLDALLVANNKLTRFNPMSLLGHESLQSLDLSGNNMSGRVSGFVYCPSLEILDLSSNALEGELDSSVNNCKQLKTLNLSMNVLNGTIPNSFGAGLRNIERILMSGNRFSGSIPYELGLNACKTLLELDLSVNLLSGTIPSSFSSCNSLYSINLSNNQLSGSFPVNLIASLTSLKNLLLSYNNITGSLPNSLSIFPNLENLDLSSNKIKGTISQSFCKPSNLPLQKLYLQNNLLSGNVPSGLAECNQLRSLDLSFNFLTGSIPPSLGSLQYLQDLVMWLNKLEGEIPVELTRIHTLENLILDNNLLTGTIPVGFRNCTNLMWISLSSNRLSGTIPTWIGELDKLAILQLGNNTFSGTIPKELGNCKSLIWLDLNSNQLEGGIPAELSLVSGKIHAGAVSGKLYAFLRNEAGSSCRGAGGLVEFAGIRPEEINRIPVLHSCKYTRVYRGTTMYQFKDNGTMIFIDFSYNNLTGNIPDGIGSMYYLQVLNLGHNNLTGAIPSSLGSLKQLGLLDLSYNKLAGRIPSELSGLSFMSDLDFSNNDLSGEIPIGGQLSTFPPIRYENNTGLCGVPLPACSPDSPLGSGLDSRSKHKNPSLAGSVAMGLLVALLCIFGLIVLIIETRRRKKQDEVRDIYMDSLPTSGNGSWKFAGTLEPLSINVATFEKPLRKLTFAHLLEATNGFNADSLIGSGGFGDVYKAQLKDGTVVAIKKLIHISGQGDREFMAEMETIGKIKHRNLVPLLGYCKVGEERLLVYEYMTYGSLENVLHNQQKGGIKLDWWTRKKIAIGAARGLAFLHHSCIPHIIHRDMKSSNVLIDENLEARVSDFGMARLMNAMDTHLSVSTLAGTPGYVPPEYYQSFRCTTKGDVYSYGVVLLELLTGRKPTDSVDFGDNNLVGWVKQQAKTKISDIFEPELMKDQALEMELLQHLKIACECLDDRPWRRPTMIQVLAMFRDLQKDGDDTELDSFSLVDANVDETADPEV